MGNAFRANIFFPIIVAGRAAPLQYPACYLADFLVKHTWFQRGTLGAFGPTELANELRLAADGPAAWRPSCMTRRRCLPCGRRRNAGSLAQASAAICTFPFAGIEALTHGLGGA